MSEGAGLLLMFWDIFPGCAVFHICMNRHTYLLVESVRCIYVEDIY